jgi:hypothetical protein
LPFAGLFDYKKKNVSKKRPLTQKPTSASQVTSLTLDLALADSFPFAGLFDCKQRPSANHPFTPKPTIITTPSTPPKLHSTKLTLTFDRSPLLKGLLPCNSAAPALTTESTPSPTILPTVLLALSTALSLEDDDDSPFFGLTFLAALLVTFFAASLALGAAFLAAFLGSAAAFFTVLAAFFAVSFGLAAAFFAVALGFAAAFLAVVVAFFLVGDFFLVMPAALVRGPAPAVFFAFFFSGEGAVGLGAEALAFSYYGEGSVWVILWECRWTSGDGVDGEVRMEREGGAYDSLDASADALWSSRSGADIAGGAGFGHDVELAVAGEGG